MILSDLPIGARVREPKSGIVFVIAAHEHPGYTGTTLITDKIVAKRCIDAMEPTHPDRWVKILGNNDYPVSNIHQWLNSDQENWFYKQTETDEAPTDDKVKKGAGYADEPGFLTWFSETFKNALIENMIPCTTGVGEEQRGILVAAKAYLLSSDEMGLQSRRFSKVQEGSMMPLFHDFRARIGIKPTLFEDFDFPASDINESNQEMIWEYWMRTPHHMKPWYHSFVHCSGQMSYLQAYNNTLGVRPAVQIDPGLKVSDTCDEQYIYDILRGGDAG